MELSLDPPDTLFIRRVADDAIVVTERVLRQSFLLTPDEVVEPWAGDAAALDSVAVEAILALQPELVVLGTGSRQQFPPPAVQAEFLRRGIGIEAMDNAAAARTFNLLAGEHRRVVAAFVLQ